MTSFYLASNYSRRDELILYRNKLIKAGHEVNSRWLFGDHEYRENYEKGYENQRFAQEDLEDILRSDIFMVFTSPNHMGRGGYHVETGIAIMQAKHIIIIGRKMNVFHFLPGIETYEIFEDFMRYM